MNGTARAAKTTGGNRDGLNVMILGVGSFAHSTASILTAAGANVVTYLTRDYGHHGAQTVHAHWGAHAHADHDDSETEGPRFDAEAHDRAVYLTVFVAAAVTAVPVLAIPEATFDAAPAAESAGHRAVAVAHGHDPPFLRSLPARAPPARLS